MNWLFVLNIFCHVFVACFIIFLNYKFDFVFLRNWSAIFLLSTIITSLNVVLSKVYYKANKTSKIKVFLFATLNYSFLLLYFFYSALLCNKKFCFYQNYDYSFPLYTNYIPVFNFLILLYFHEKKIYTCIFLFFKTNWASLSVIEKCFFPIFLFKKWFLKIYKFFKINCVSLNFFAVCFVIIFIFCFAIFCGFIVFSNLKYKFNLNFILNLFLIAFVFIVLLFIVLNVILDIFFSNQNLTNQRFCVEQNKTQIVNCKKCF